MAGATPVCLKRHEVLFREGDVSDGLYIVKEGSLDIFRSRDGQDIILAELKPGEILGTVSLFSQQTRSAGARAKVECKLMFLPSEVLTSYFDKMPTWMKAVFKDAVSRLRQIDEQFVESRLREKLLVDKFAASHLHVAGNLACFIGSLMKRDLVEDEGVTLLPLKGVIAEAERILNREGSELEEVLEALVGSGLLRWVENRKYGKSLGKSSYGVLSDFQLFAVNVAKKGIDNFIPTKHEPWLTKLIKLSLKDDSLCSNWNILEMLKTLEKRAGRPPPLDLVEILEGVKAIQLSADRTSFSFSVRALKKRIVFESACRRLVRMGDKSLKAA